MPLAGFDPKSGTYYDFYALNYKPLLVNLQKPVKFVFVDLGKYEPVSCSMPFTLK